MQQRLYVRHGAAGPMGPTRLLAAALILTAGLSGCIGQDLPGPTGQTPDGGTGSPAPSAEAREGTDGTNTSDRSDRHPPWPSLDEATIRPGASVLTFTSDTGEEWPACTANFVFRSPDNASLYLGTAAHCVTDHEIGATVDVAEGEASGTLVYSSWKALGGEEEWTGAKLYNDLALIRIPDAHRAKVHPAVVHYGGPTGLASPPDTGDQLLTYGDTEYREVAPGTDRLDPRRGVVTTANASWTMAYFTGPSIWGDSGSPVMTADGQALGVMSIWNYYLPWTNRPPEESLPHSNGLSNLGPALDFLHDETDLRVELVTWPMLTDEPVP